MIKITKFILQILVLRESHRQTASLIVQLSRTAIGRLLAGDAPLRAPVLFTPEEHQQLADSLAGIIAAGDLLGRARVREKAKLAGQEAETFAEGDPLPDPFKGYTPIPALPPKRAVDYFRGLVPSLAQGAERYGPLLDRHAFTLAHATDQVILEKVKGAILRALETGVSTTPDVQDLLDSAGVSPRNPQYADMVVRTNVMDAYNQGTAAEMSEPGMREFFPVWRYDGILDDRTGDDHRPLIGRYWPADAPFPQVRGPRVFNCRCSPTPVSKYEWRRLAAGGARVEP
jgi:SPP1 gp7 family putative phage head morphogenesis protein